MTKPIDVRVAGPLAAHALGFCDELARQHYTPLSAANQLRVMAHLSRWLDRKRLEPRELSLDRVEQFLRARRRAGYTGWLSLRGLGPLLGYLRRLGIVPDVPPQVPATAVDRFVNEYVDYLQDERALAERSILFRESIARDFLAASTSKTGALAFDRLDAQHVTDFMLDRIRGYSTASAGNVATAVRSLLRFLHLRGHIDAPLTGAVPKIAGWRLAPVPRGIEPERVTQLLGSCDRRTRVGRRDYAMLVLLVRLGLRAGEVALLRLEDVDWRRGEIVVRGKGGRRDRLPLPADVGDALAAYLRRGRPPCEARTVFVSSRAPHGPLGAPAVSMRVSEASVRAGMERVNAHQLRHTAATQMLRSGASLADIGQVLRHRTQATTAIYAKVDLESLRSLAQPWPGGAS